MRRNIQYYPPVIVLKFKGKEEIVCLIQVKEGFI